MTPSSRGRGWAKALGLFLAGALTAGASAWAFFTIVTPPEDPLDESKFALVTVATGEVGSSIQLNTVAEWVPTPVGVNRAAGVVTSVSVSSDAESSAGSTLYAVNLRPVVVATGEVPAFRDIGLDARGDDVKQLQQLLADLGFYRGAVVGEVGQQTVNAIKSWQKSLGVEQTGVVLAGDIIFIPALPARLVLDSTTVVRGMTLSGGEAALSTLPSTPTFSMPVTDAQASMMPSGTRVEITSPTGASWTGYVGEQTRDAETGTVSLSLAGADGAAICADQCAEVSITGQPMLLSSKIVTVETAAGLVVPSSALVSSADGRLQVIDEAGERINVTVVASARGRSVVDGVQEGAKVRVPGGGAP